jgi:hypothetical protein
LHPALITRHLIIQQKIADLGKYIGNNLYICLDMHGYCQAAVNPQLLLIKIALACA